MKNIASVRPVLILVSLSILAGFLVKTQSQVRPPEVVTASERISRTAFFGQRIVQVGPLRASETESQFLWELLNAARASDYTTGLAELEQYLGAFTNSPWAPSLDAALGKYYFDSGRHTLALEHWELAWAATKNYPSGSGKSVADFTLAFWTRLLASLGRYEALSVLVQENRGRILDRGPL